MTPVLPLTDVTSECRLSQMAAVVHLFYGRVVLHRGVHHTFLFLQPVPFPQPPLEGTQGLRRLQGAPASGSSGGRREVGCRVPSQERELCPWPPTL